LFKFQKGAFWEDRYHAAAVETGNHLISCLDYIDLNKDMSLKNLKILINVFLPRKSVV